MKQDIAALVARLRALVILDEVLSNNPLGSEAADALEAQAAEIARLTAERDRFEEALGRACLVGATAYLVERAEKAEAALDARINAAREEGRIAGLRGAAEIAQSLHDRAATKGQVLNRNTVGKAILAKIKEADHD